MGSAGFVTQHSARATSCLFLTDFCRPYPGSNAVPFEEQYSMNAVRQVVYSEGCHLLYLQKKGIIRLTMRVYI